MRKVFHTIAALALGALFSVPAFAQTAVTNFGGNLIVNPWMEIDQPMEGTTLTMTSTAAGTFTYGGGGSAAAFTLGTTDGWGTTVATSASSNTLVMQNPNLLMNGSTTDMLYTIGTGSATHADGTLLTIEQRIEPFRIAPLQYGTGNAQISYLQFCAKASIAGNYGFYISGGTAARTSDIAAGTSGSAYFHQFNIPTAAQVACYSFVIPPDTGGTWLTTTNTVDATHGATLGFVLGINGVTSVKYGVPTTTLADGVWQNLSSGANVIGSNANYVAMDKTSGATFELSAVKWSLDGNPLTHNPEFELMQAQRYYAKTTNAGVGGVSGTTARQSTVIGSLCNAAGSAAAKAVSVYWNFPMQMRTIPTIVTYNPSAANANMRDTTAAADLTVVVDAFSAKSRYGVYIGTSGTPTTAGDVCCIQASADARL